MLLQSGHTLSGGDHVCHGQGPGQKTNTLESSTQAVTRYLDIVQDSLKEGWSVHASKDGRLYYCK